LYKEPPYLSEEIRVRSDFRYDINLLRAFAVGAVVAFHFQIPGFQGGFAGVDVFLVISGYLIFSHISERLSAGRFSIYDFYASRLARVTPALVAMVVATLLCVMLFCDPITASATGRTAASSVVYLSNLYYPTLGGYFSAPAEENWLLHTWSLSLEMQFYLICPLLLLLMHGRPFWMRYRVPILLAVCLLATIPFFILSYQHPRLGLYGFFFLPTRIWEFLIGGCVAFSSCAHWSRAARRRLSAAGWTALALFMFGFQSAAPWPSVWTLVPVLATASIIAADLSPAAAFRRGVVHNVGLWSYSIYLWHWPVVCALHYFLDDLTAFSTSAGLALSVALGALSYRWLERAAPARGSVTALPLNRRHATFAGLAFTLAGCLLLFTTNGLDAMKRAHMTPTAQARLGDYRQALASWSIMAPCPARSRFESGVRCEVHGPDGPHGLLIGDSHLHQLIPRLVGYEGRHRITVLMRDGCAALPGSGSSHYQCARFLDAAFREARSGRYDRVLLISHWNRFLSDMPDEAARPCRDDGIWCALATTGRRLVHRRTRDGMRALAARIREIKAAGVEVLILAPYPTLEQYQAANGVSDLSALSLYRRTYLTDSDMVIRDISREAARKQLARTDAALDAIARASGATVVDPLPDLCDRTCSPYLNGHFIFRDDNHITDFGILSHRFDYVSRALLGARRGMQ
jgi:peptidoglycan/LPS O-acetylase OafA/YrhL